MPSASSLLLATVFYLVNVKDIINTSLSFRNLDLSLRRQDSLKITQFQQHESNNHEIAFKTKCTFQTPSVNQAN